MGGAKWETTKMPKRTVSCEECGKKGTPWAIQKRVKWDNTARLLCAPCRNKLGYEDQTAGPPPVAWRSL